eukprot:scaffold623470_cov20-Prasinocladus_malaysianus.AAC.1
MAFLHRKGTYDKSIGTYAIRIGDMIRASGGQPCRKSHGGWGIRLMCFKLTVGHEEIRSLHC